MTTTQSTPTAVVTDRAAAYPSVTDELLPGAFHDVEQYANNRMESDHGRLKARLRSMRGLKSDKAARLLVAGHTFVQNPPRRQRVAAASTELGAVI